MWIDPEKGGNMRTSLMDSAAGKPWCEKKGGALDRRSRLSSLANLPELANFLPIEQPILNQFGDYFVMGPDGYFIER